MDPTKPFRELLDRKLWPLALVLLLALVAVGVVVSVVVLLGEQVVQAEEPLERRLEDGQISLVLDERSRQSRLDRRPVGDLQLPESAQRVYGLRRGDANVLEPQKPDEAVDDLIHD